VTQSPYFRFYAGAKLVIEGDVAVGTLCVISPHPREDFDVKEQSILLSLAQTVSFMLQQEYTAHVNSRVQLSVALSEREPKRSQ
jgi:GAF domain-containing protein